jgi:histidinol-phosphate aminotransferase
LSAAAEKGRKQAGPQTPAITAPAPRPHILALAAYELAEPAPAGLRRAIHLSQNENATPASPAAIEAARQALTEANRYPHGDAGPLREAIGAAEKLPAERIVCAAGSMELLSLLAHAYLGPGDEVVVSEHGYLYFRSVARLVGAGIARAPERDLAMDVDALLGAVSSRTRMLLLANPNNPTGSLLTASEIRRLRAGLRPDILLVLDGAYADYVTDPGFDASAGLVDAGANTVMIRTFSKIHGLAGLRVGWGYFPAAIADIINRIRHPNGVTQPGMAAASVAIGERERIAKLRAANAEIRDRFAGELRAMGLRPYPSHGNFLLARFADAATAAKAYGFLKGEGIFLRPMGGYGLGDFLRITIGTAEEMASLAEALRTWTASR